MPKENNSSNLHEQIHDLKKEVRDMSYKVDLILEILNNFTIILAEEEEHDDEYDSDNTWVPKEDDFWEDDNEA